MTHRSLIVAKFGGTSVANWQSMQRCAGIILSDSRVRLVVLSASAGVTDLLVKLAAGQQAGQRAFLLDEIRRIQYAILEKLQQPARVHKEIDRILETITMLSEACALASSGALTDELISQGELMSTRLFAEIVREHGGPATWFDVRECLLTDDHFGHAKPDLPQLKARVRQQIEPQLTETRVITQGFIGRESEGRTTTLGRGGSDYTAALLGEALQAERIDIWTDVPGIYTTDPHIVPAARRIDEISFAEATEMATFGAKILHPATLMPAVRGQIPVFVGSSKEPDAGGTRIYDKTATAPLFRALALRRRQTLLTLHSLNMLHARGFLAEVFTLLARHNIAVDLITTSEVSVALTLDTAASPTCPDDPLPSELLEQLAHLCQVEIEHNLALVALVGNQLFQAKGVGKDVFHVLESFSLRLICYGASSHNLCFLVSENEAKEVVRQLHRHLFE